MNTTNTSLTQIGSAIPRLDTADIAAILGVTREHVTDRITKRPDFPKPFINVSRRLRYWRKSDVAKWLENGGS